MKGKFIVIEGIDGCGKTTQIDELSKWLPSSGLINEGSKLIKTREPGGSLLGKKLRGLILVNNKVAMIGDGINDVPALASSDLGIAVGSGTQIAKANADIVLMGDQLSGLPYAFNLAKKTIRKIKQNLTWAFGYNLLAIPLAAGLLFPKYGILLTPSIAALLMATSSITVVINALSLD